jgi:Asp-tRNA(Asn)/Glu-tRNA(Gln) amidotransferase A subunit family amidase
VKTGRRRAVDVIAETLHRIAEDRSNAFTVVLRESAMARAAEVDSAVVGGPLAGVPITVKDHVWLSGELATNGSRALAGFVAPSSAVCVQRLLDAGAIVVGKTNNPEFCYRGVTFNDLWGETNNPRDPTRTAGGSSGGAAASVAAGLVPIAVGTDGGGSIRIPSAFCGVYGIKPTFGLVPKMPGFRGWPTLSATGPIAGSVADLALALSIMAGPASADFLTYPSGGSGYLDAVASSSWAGLSIAVSEDLGISAIDPDVRSAVRAAVSAMSDAGARIVARALPAADPTALWDAIALPEGYASEGPLVESAPDLVGADAAAITLAGAGFTAKDYLDAQDARADYAAGWAELFEDVDAVVSPAMPVTAFPLGRLTPETIDGTPVPPSFDAWCALALPANLAGLPAACLPVGAGRDGLPVGLQVLAARGADATVLRVAALADSAVRGVHGSR